jgi:hypothetical protein
MISGIAPFGDYLVALAYILTEEEEKNSLRVMLPVTYNSPLHSPPKDLNLESLLERIRKFLQMHCQFIIMRIIVQLTIDLVTCKLNLCFTLSLHTI